MNGEATSERYWRIVQLIAGSAAIAWGAILVLAYVYTVGQFSIVGENLQATLSISELVANSSPTIFPIVFFIYTAIIFYSFIERLIFATEQVYDTDGAKQKKVRLKTSNILMLLAIIIVLFVFRNSHDLLRFNGLFLFFLFFVRSLSSYQAEKSELKSLKFKETIKNSTLCLLFLIFTTYYQGQYDIRSKMSNISKSETYFNVDGSKTKIAVLISSANIMYVFDGNKIFPLRSDQYGSLSIVPQDYLIPARSVFVNWLADSWDRIRQYGQK